MNQQEINAFNDPTNEQQIDTLSVEKLEFSKWSEHQRHQGYMFKKLLTEKQWAVISPLLPARPEESQLGNLLFIEGIHNVWLSGGLWDAWPDDLGDQKKAYQRTMEWAKQGIWAKIAARLSPFSKAGLILRVTAYQFTNWKE